MDSCAAHGEIPLHLAGAQGHVAVLKVLLPDASPAAAALANLADCAGRMPLIHAAERGHVPTARMLLERGAAVDARDAAGRTALMLAAAAAKVDTVKLLLGRGADVGLRDRDGHAAAFFALHSRPGGSGAAAEAVGREAARRAVAKLLLDRYAAVVAGQWDPEWIALRQLLLDTALGKSAPGAEQTGAKAKHDPVPNSHPAQAPQAAIPRARLRSWCTSVFTGRRQVPLLQAHQERLLLLLCRRAFKRPGPPWIL